jgi:DNA polymerase-4
MMPGFCRDCLSDAPETTTRCRACGSPRLMRHKEIEVLSVAHVDCDAFYATIEKRDNPSLADKPLIVGGGRRGVVSTACYIARTFGVRSAMPMFEARRLCPHAEIVPPNMSKYVAVAREVRRLMLDLTPQVEPVSIDEAFMDLSGTTRLHGMPPAKSLARFASAVDAQLGITVSVGLSVNKFLAKIASDLDKPRGFAVLGGTEAATFLADRPVSLIFGVGRVAQQRLEKEGFRKIADLQKAEEADLMRRFGAEGQRLWRLARGIDHRQIVPDRDAKSISAETTFKEDIADLRPLEEILWGLSEKVSARLKAKSLAGSTITLKLKSADFRLKTRSRSLDNPTQLAGKIYAAGHDLLAREIDGTKYRLIGIGVAALTSDEKADPADLIDIRGRRDAAAERALDKLRERFGKHAILKGLGLGSRDRDED